MRFILVTVKVTNNIGHKFPTSFPSRRAWIHFTATNEAGDIVFESGKLNANGSIVGNNGDADSSAFEPHYSEISTSDQVQIYEPIMVDTDGAVTHTLLRAAAFVKDNRVLPTGFDKQTVPNDIAVKGAAFDDTDFVGGGDTVVYRLAKGSATSLNINATLLYQTIAYGHIQDMFADADQVTEIADFQRYFDNASIRSELISEATQSYIVSTDDGSGDDGTGDDGTGDDGSGGSDDGSDDTPVTPTPTPEPSSSGGGSTGIFSLLLLTAVVLRKRFALANQ